MGKGGGDKLKRSYKAAFEESFVEDYKQWFKTMADANAIIVIIAEEYGGGKIEPYTYDDFCCLAKQVMEEKLDSIDWDSVIRDERELVKFQKRSTRSKQIAQRASLFIDRMESDVLFTCFETSVRERVGLELYEMCKEHMSNLRQYDISFQE